MVGRGEGMVGFSAPTSTVGPQHIDALLITTLFTQGAYLNDCTIAHTPCTNTRGVALGGRGVHNRMGIDHVPMGGINAPSINPPHTREVGGYIDRPIASTTTPPHSLGVMPHRVPIEGSVGGDRPRPPCSRHSPPSTPRHDGKPKAYPNGCDPMPTVVPQGGRGGETWT